MAAEFYAFGIRVSPLGGGGKNVGDFSCVQQGYYVIIVIFVNLVYSGYRQAGSFYGAGVSFGTVKGKA